MKGGGFELLGAIILMIVLLAVLWPMLPVKGFSLEEIFESQELATPIEEPEETESLYRSSELPESRKLIETDDDFYVSEIACDIATDVYKDFTTAGEKPSLVYSGPLLEAGDARCEYSPDMQDYVCLVGQGSFILKGDKTLTDAIWGELKTKGCCKLVTSYCGCGIKTTFKEFKFDETCINEFFREFEFEGVDFCTWSKDYYLRPLGQKLKFGNQECVKDTDNDGLTSTEGWVWNDPLTCKTLCDAVGEDTLYEKDYNRIRGFWVDELSSAYIVNDKFLASDDDIVYSSDKSKILENHEYFYNVLWFNKEKQYVIMFTRVPHQEVRDFTTEANFADFVDDFFGEANSRKTTAGIYWADIANVYDSIVTIPEISIANIESFLESKFNIYVNDIECYDEEECLNYPLQLEIWGEWLQNEKTGEITDLSEVRDETPILIRKTIEGDNLPAGEYRLIIRNWYSGLFYDDTEKEECSKSCDILDPHRWCKNENIRTPGKKIFEIDGTACPPESLLISMCCNILHHKIKRYVDKTIILIPIT